MQNAEVVIVGGGLLGTSTAYHLACLGLRGVRLLERLDIANAASCRAAGLMFRVSPKPLIDPFSRVTFSAIRALESQLGECLDFRQAGTLRIADTPASRSALEAMHLRAVRDGIPAGRVDGKWCKAALPWLRTRRNSLTVFFPEDGFIDPYRLTTAYARAAAKRGVRVETGVAVHAVHLSGGRVSGVETSKGRYASEKVVLAAGSWANRLTMPLGVSLPMVPTRSHFWIASPEPVFAGDQPMTVHADARAYTRPEVGGLLIGLQETRSRTFDYRRLPDDIGTFAVTESGAEWDTLLEAQPRVSRFFPALQDLRFDSYTAGLSAYTPDGRFILGEIAGVPGLYVAAGCCGSGLKASGGIGEAIAGLIVNGKSAHDLSAFDPGRFGSVDPASPGFQSCCADARARKVDFS